MLWVAIVLCAEPLSLTHPLPLSFSLTHFLLSLPLSLPHTPLPLSSLSSPSFPLSPSLPLLPSPLSLSFLSHHESGHTLARSKQRIRVRSTILLFCYMCVCDHFHDLCTCVHVYVCVPVCVTVCMMCVCVTICMFVCVRPFVCRVCVV